MQRLTWKEGLLARLDARAGAAPVALPPAAEWAGLMADDYAFRRVRARGVYEGADALVFAGPASIDRGPAQPGYFVLTPFRLADGGVVLVNRGFAPMELAEKGGYAPPPAGETGIVGLMRPPERRGPFTPADEPGRGRFFTQDAAAIAAARGLADAAPFAVDLDDSGPGWPRGGVGAQRPPNNHLSYALTWFGLAAALAVFFVVWARRR
ncbi:MAG: SURF1 family protein [Methylobacteriaceae bacterium]|nr:SURF1 family protein [Methylobacteriaceae bacterium]